MVAVRSVVFVALFYVWSAVVAIGCTPLLVCPHRWALKMFTIWSSGIIALLRICGITVEVRGREHMPSGAGLVAPKHQCMFDVFAQFAVMPATCFVMKRELARIPWFGWYARKVRTIVIDREGSSASLRQMVREAKERFTEDRQVVIFPEGHRNEPGVAGDYKPGIAALYRELGVAVHPVATNSGVHWPAHGFVRKPGTIVFEYLEPIPAGLKRAEFMRQLQDRIETASAKLLSL